MKWFLLIAAISGCVSICCIAASTRLHDQADDAASSVAKHRQRRETHNIIEDCITVTSKEGQFLYTSSPKDELVPGRTCGLYLITDSERLIEIEIIHADISCEDGGLSVVDGWELNGEYFPAPDDHELPLNQRVVSECGNHHSRRRYLSSQNAALIQYRVPNYGQGFAIRVHYVKNPQPCNILVEGTSNIYTLSNYGRHINCSVTLLFPATVSLISLDVGNLGGHSLSAHRRGIIRHCGENGMADYLQIGGSSRLDGTDLLIADSLCGFSHESKSIEESIACGITTVRLVSSGRHHNLAQVAIRPAEEEDLFSASLMCPQDNTKIDH